MLIFIILCSFGKFTLLNFPVCQITEVPEKSLCKVNYSGQKAKWWQKTSLCFVLVMVVVLNDNNSREKLNRTKKGLKKLWPT